MLFHKEHQTLLEVFRKKKKRKRKDPSNSFLRSSEVFLLPLLMVVSTLFPTSG